MAKTQTFKTEAGEVTLKRPTFDQMRQLGDRAGELFQADSAQALVFSDTFDELLKTVAETEEDYERIINECDLVDVWELWEGFVKFARFQSFFEEAEASHQKRQVALAEAKAERDKAQIDLLKKQGIVPENFSLTDVLGSQMDDIVKQAMSDHGSTSRPKKPARKR